MKALKISLYLNWNILKQKVVWNSFYFILRGPMYNYWSIWNSRSIYCFQKIDMLVKWKIVLPFKNDFFLLKAHNSSSLSPKIVTCTFSFGAIFKVIVRIYFTENSIDPKAKLYFEKYQFFKKQIVHLIEKFTEKIFKFQVFSPILC